MGVDRAPRLHKLQNYLTHVLLRHMPDITVCPQLAVSSCSFIYSLAGSIKLLGGSSSSTDRPQAGAFWLAALGHVLT